MIDLTKVGVSIEDVIKSNITSYLKGFDDALECLTEARKNIDVEAMKKIMIKNIQEATIANDKF